MRSTLGKLFLIPTTLGENPPLEVLPISVKKVIEETNVFIVENEKSARRFIKKISPKTPQSALEIFKLNKFTQPIEIPEFLEPCLNGLNVGLLSEAGCPGVADPGADVVKLAHKREIKVIPLVGPSSILLALMASGLNGQNFTFNGYLPIDKVERKKEIKRLERLSFEQNQAQIFIETPYRNNSLLEDIYKTVHPDTSICVACDITLSTELIKTLPAKIWSKKNVDLHKRPTIFIIQKG